MGFLTNIFSLFMENKQEKEQKAKQERIKRNEIAKAKNIKYFSNTERSLNYIKEQSRIGSTLYVMSKYFPKENFNNKLLVYEMLKIRNEINGTTRGTLEVDKQQIVAEHIFKNRDNNKIFQDLKPYFLSSNINDSKQFFLSFKDILSRCFEEEKALKMLTMYPDFMKHIDKSVTEKEDFIYKAINKNIEVIKPYVDNKLLTKDFLLNLYNYSSDKKIFSNMYNQEIFTKIFIDNKDLLLEICQENKEIYEHLPFDIYERFGVEQTGEYSKFIENLEDNIEYNNEKNVVKYKNFEQLKEGIQKLGVFECLYARDDIFNNQENVLELMKLNPKVYQFLPQSLKENKDIAKIAVLDVSNMEHLPKKFLDNNLFMKQALLKNPKIYSYLPEEMKKDLSIAKDVIEAVPSLLKDAPFEVKDDFSFIEHMVKKDPFIVVYASERLKDNYDIAIEALKINGYAMKFINQDLLKNNLELVSIAVKNSKAAFNIVDEDLKQAFGSTREEFIKGITVHLQQVYKHQQEVNSQTIETKYDSKEQVTEVLDDEEINYQRQK